MATVDELLHKLSTGEYYDRSTAARALGTVSDPRIVDALIHALNDEDEWVIETAAESLGQLGDPKACDALTPLLDHREYKVRTAAASALAALGDPAALPALQAHAKDPDSWVREAIQEAITELETGGSRKPRVTIARPQQPAPLRAAPDDSAPADPDALVLAAAQQVYAQHKRLNDGSHFLRVPLSSGRHQKVRVVTSEMSSKGEPRMRFLTIVASATQEAVTWAMRQNMRITRGAIGLQRLRKQDYLALTETVLLGEAHAADIADALERVARRGDRLEQLLCDEDTW